MTKMIQCVLKTIAIGALLAPAAVHAGSQCDPDGVQDSGSIYRICMPDPGDYNGELVLWAHGFQDAGTPVQIPEDQLQFGAVYLPELINALGYGFATNSYRKTGLAIQEGAEDIVDLVSIFTDQKGAPAKTFLTGASEGGIITTLLMEREPEIFTAGVAACGPIGDFVYQINYFGNGRALFDYFFPGVIPGNPFQPPLPLVQNWGEYYDTIVKPVLLDPANSGRFDQLVRTGRMPFDPDDYKNTAENSIKDVLRYSVVNLLDAQDTIGGFPFGNATTYYTGSDDDLMLNTNIVRAVADPYALEQMGKLYNTRGVLQRPLVTIHTVLDQQVPYPHEPMYIMKTLASGAYLNQHFNFRYDRYGHCNFQITEVLIAFSLMTFLGSDVQLTGLESYLDTAQLERFEAMARKVALPYRVEGERLAVEPVTRH